MHHNLIDSRLTSIPPLGQQIFDVAMTEIETKVEPHRVLNDARWKSMSFVGGRTNVHAGIVTQQQLT